MSSSILAIVVEGLFEKSDSIGYDAIYQYFQFSRILGPDSVRIFAKHFDVHRYPDVPIQPLAEFTRWAATNPDATVVYQFCDGWPEFEDMLLVHSGRVIVRWHNNTPPWFYADRASDLLRRTLNGFRTVVRLAMRCKYEVWVNSTFSARQLEVLGCRAAIKVVFPGSRTLLRAPVSSNFTYDGETIRLLFVSRIVAHKGHKHIMRIADLLSRKLSKQVEVTFPGRRDSSATALNAELENYAAMLSSRVQVNFCGEVSEDELVSLYDRTDVLVCMSEHEGFGLPVFEAMLRGKPVVAWGNSATGDMLDGHPLMRRNFDPEMFRDIIADLLDPECWTKIIHAQKDLLVRYSEAVVYEQIVNAFLSESARPFDVERKAFFSSNSVASSDVTAPVEFNFDFDGNFVSLYDLSAYEKLLDRSDKMTLFSNGESAPQSGELVFQVNEFSYHDGSIDGTAYKLQAEKIEHRHVVFGPYIEVPAGRYRVKFFIQLCGDIRLLEGRLEVASEGAVFASRPIGNLVSDEEWWIEFHAETRKRQCEFRVWIERAEGLSFSFGGCGVSKLPALESLLPAALERDVWHRILPRGKRHTSFWNAMQHFLSRTRKKQARGKFVKGDRERDAKGWAAASVAYMEGLKLDPSRVEYWIQLGNVSKEAGLWDIAANAYKSAIDLDPGCCEAYLQYGHLLKTTGDLLGAEHLYLKAVVGGGANVEAIVELMALGLDFDVLRTAVRKT